MTDFVLLTTVHSRVEEDQLRAFLEANEIPVKVRGEALRKTHGFTVDGLGAVDILVHQAKLVEARELLDRVERGDLQIGES